MNSIQNFNRRMIRRNFGVQLRGESDLPVGNSGALELEQTFFGQIVVGLTRSLDNVLLWLCLRQYARGHTTESAANHKRNRAPAHHCSSQCGLKSTVQELRHSL